VWPEAFHKRQEEAPKAWHVWDSGSECGRLWGLLGVATVSALERANAPPAVQAVQMRGHNTVTKMPPLGAALCGLERQVLRRILRPGSYGLGWEPEACLSPGLDRSPYLRDRRSLGTAGTNC
jgi:hypothetical protein